MITLIFFLYGLASGLVLIRLYKQRRRGSQAGGLPVVLGWVLMAVSFSISVLLFSWALWIQLSEFAP